MVVDIKNWKNDSAARLVMLSQHLNPTGELNQNMLDRATDAAYAVGLMEEKFPKNILQDERWKQEDHTALLDNTRQLAHNLNLLNPDGKENIISSYIVAVTEDAHTRFSNPEAKPTAVEEFKSAIFPVPMAGAEMSGENLLKDFSVSQERSSSKSHPRINTSGRGAGLGAA